MIKNQTLNKVSENPFQVLEEDDYGDVENNNMVIQIIAQDIRIEDLSKKRDQVIKRIEKIKEIYDVETINIQVLKALLITAADKLETIFHKIDDEHVEADSMCNECVQRFMYKELEKAVERCNAVNRTLNATRNNTNQVKADYNNLKVKYLELENNYKQIKHERRIAI